jgi:hypothetical protein
MLREGRAYVDDRVLEHVHGLAVVVRDLNVDSSPSGAFGGGIL